MLSISSYIPFVLSLRKTCFFVAIIPLETRLSSFPSMSRAVVIRNDVYIATIELIKVREVDKSRLWVAALVWISDAKRLPQADELSHALAVQLGSTEFDIDVGELLSRAYYSR